MPSLWYLSVLLKKQFAKKPTKNKTEHWFSPEIQKLFLSNWRWECGRVRWKRCVSSHSHWDREKETTHCGVSRYKLSTSPFFFFSLSMSRFQSGQHSQNKSGRNSRQRRKFEDSEKLSCSSDSQSLFFSVLRSWLPSQLQTNRWTRVPVYTPTCPIMSGGSSCQLWRLTLCL